jgi:rod shape-determining protein MreC
VGALLLYPFLAFLTRGSAVRSPNLFDRALVGVTAPVQHVLTWAIDGVISTGRRYVALRGVEADNERLRARNAELEGEVVGFEEAKAENARLQKLLAYAEQQPGLKVAARIIGLNPVSTLLSVRIDRGTNAGIEKGMPVVTPQGVVGQVLRAGGDWADVLLAEDTNSRIGVSIARSRARATAAGSGGDRALRLDNASRTEDVVDGDQVVTSGADGVFPPGLPVGKIAGVRHELSGMFQLAEIVPAVDPVRLEEVLVLSAPANRISAEASPK